MKKLAVLLLFALCSSLFGDVTLPAEVKTAKGSWAIIVPTKVDGGQVKWRLGPKLTLVDLSALFPNVKAAGIVVMSSEDVTSYVEAWNAKGDVASDIVKCKVVIGTGGDPDVPPTPTPVDDELTKSIKDAFSKETSTDKATQVKTLAAIYKAAAELASDKSITITKQLLTAIQTESKKRLKDTDLLKIRKDTLQTFLNKTLPTDPFKVLTDADRALMKETYSKIGSILEGLK
jgi:hypothetical protein